MSLSKTLKPLFAIDHLKFGQRVRSKRSSRSKRISDGYKRGPLATDALNAQSF